MIDAIRASISIPGIFTPVRIEGRYLVDGGLVNEVPVSICRQMGADYVIGVNVVPDPEKMMQKSKISDEDEIRQIDSSISRLAKKNAKYSRLKPPNMIEVVRCD